MKSIVQPELHDAVLKEWRGAHANVWMFHVSHKRIALRLAKPDEPEVIYVVAVGCEHITGPFSWNAAKISVVAEPPNARGEVRRRIFDRGAGFELRCSDVTIVRGPASDLDNTFENFLGDAPRG